MTRPAPEVTRAERNHMYNYTKAMAQDIREYIADEIELGGV